MECSSHEKGTSCEICNHFVNDLPMRKLSIFNNKITITFDLVNKGQLVN
jgi:hypothetical protein